MNQQNLSLVDGDTGSYQATLTDQNGVLINDATASYEMTVKNSYADADGAAIFKVTATQTTPGVAFLTVAPASYTATTTPPAVLVYDIRVRETSGRVTTIARGTWSILAAVLQVP